MSMEAIDIWLLIALCGVATFLSRFLLISEIAPKKLPDWLSEAMGFVPVAILTAIIVPAVLMPEGSIEIEGNWRILAAIIAGIVALTSRNVIATLAAGLVSLWLLMAFLG